MEINYKLHHGNCLEILRTLPAASVDAVVSDPPYGLSFMGKKWDYDVPSADIWRECLRVLKPGGHLLAFAGTRTQHRMAVRIEDAGFEIRDMIAWVYGSGFPKSHNLNGEWQGWGTALKPALEPITVARKPLQGTVAANVLQHGTGALNIDGCRVDEPLEGDPMRFAKTDGGAFVAKFDKGPVVRAAGRWPANLIHDGSEEVVGLFPVSVARPVKPENIGVSGTGNHTASEWTIGVKVMTGYYDTETNAARFFYCAKASKRDRDEGLDGFEAKQVFGDDGDTYQGLSNSKEPSKNFHPTVKPTDLMRYLCRLITPPGGVVLDPFMGSGSTGKAAILEGFQFIGIERDEEYLEIAKARIEAAKAQRESQLL